MKIRTYSELITLPTFEERFLYLRLGGKVGAETFGFDRWINQQFYQRDDEWLETRDFIITRDNGCDLGMPDRGIETRILVHHLNPITKEDILLRRRKVFDPENLICTMKSTHDAIHYGSADLLMITPIERRRNDTCPWRS